MVVSAAVLASDGLAEAEVQQNPLFDPGVCLPSPPDCSAAPTSPPQRREETAASTSIWSSVALVAERPTCFRSQRARHLLETRTTIFMDELLTCFRPQSAPGTSLSLGRAGSRQFSAR